MRLKRGRDVECLTWRLVGRLGTIGGFSPLYHTISRPWWWYHWSKLYHFANYTRLRISGWTFTDFGPLYCRRWDTRGWRGVEKGWKRFGLWVLRRCSGCTRGWRICWFCCLGGSDNGEVTVEYAGDGRKTAKYAGAVIDRNSMGMVQ